MSQVKFLMVVVFCLVLIVPGGVSAADKWVVNSVRTEAVNGYDWAYGEPDGIMDEVKYHDSEGRLTSRHYEFYTKGIPEHREEHYIYNGDGFTKTEYRYRCCYNTIKQRIVTTYVYVYDSCGARYTLPTDEKIQINYYGDGDITNDPDEGYEEYQQVDLERQYTHLLINDPDKTEICTDITDITDQIEEKIAAKADSVNCFINCLMP